MAIVRMPPGGTEASAIPEPNFLYEVVDGRVVETLPMGALEGWIASGLSFALGLIARPNQLGREVVEVLFLIDPARGLRRRADVAFVSAERWARDRPIPRGETAWDVVPDLAVEVNIPSNYADEVIDKIAEYFRVGVRLVWAVYPSQNLVYAYESPRSVRILGVGDDLEGGPVLPGFRMPLATLFGSNYDVAAGAAG